MRRMVWERSTRSISRPASRPCCIALPKRLRMDHFLTPGLIADTGGNLYGTTDSGGSANLGTEFMLSPERTITLLHSFTGGDGAHPFGGLGRDAHGNLCGVTLGGGYDLPGLVSLTLGSFCGTVSKVSAPDGTTTGGGFLNQGTVFVINGLTGVESILYSFAGGANGSDSTTGLTGDGEGQLYGTTEDAPENNSIGNGIVFMLNIIIRAESVLASFNGTAVADPSGTFTLGANGKLYGTTYNGGTGGEQTGLTRVAGWCEIAGQLLRRDLWRRTSSLGTILRSNRSRSDQLARGVRMPFST